MRSTALLALVSINACASSPRLQPAAPVAPADTVAIELRAPATDLSGGWATGSANEPTAGPVRQQPSCAYNPPVWIIQQKGNGLETYDFPESFNQGIARKEPVQRTPAIRGTISGADVVIAGDGIRFVLRYDAESGHLRGTRNGAPFWAARQVIVREACPGIP